MFVFNSLVKQGARRVEAVVSVCLAVCLMVATHSVSVIADGWLSLVTDGALITNFHRHSHRRTIDLHTLVYMFSEISDAATDSKNGSLVADLVSVRGDRFEPHFHSICYLIIIINFVFTSRKRTMLLGYGFLLISAFLALLTIISIFFNIHV